MPPRKKSINPIPIEAVEHKDKRINIPTGQQAHLVDIEEAHPNQLLYPRDTSLDPQLVWKGKDKLDGEDLSIPGVPIYIQEKIDPRAIVENLRKTAISGQPEPELTLFNDFDGMNDLDAIEKIDFYQHEGNWQNRLILGDSLIVMASLAEKENLRGRVQMIYVDPPYGIQFGSNWQVSTRNKNVQDGRVEAASREPEVVKAFRDTWELGINSYLSYLRDRFAVARDLLTETGSLFVQIGDENVHLLRSVLDEVFGTANFNSQIVVRKTTGDSSTLLGATVDYVLWYGKDKSQTKYRQVFTKRSDDAERRYDQVLEHDGLVRPVTANERDGTMPLPTGARLFQLGDLTSPGPPGVNGLNVFAFEGKNFTPGAGHFKTNEEGMKRLEVAKRIQVTGGGASIRYRRFADDFSLATLGNLWNDISGAVQSRSDPKVYVVQTSTSLVERCLLMTTDTGDLVIDPTCGSGTSAVAAEQWGRRWITIDTSRVALALARTRLMSMRFPYYVLADSEEGIKATVRIRGRAPSMASVNNDIRKGFVCQVAPRVTLGAIAHNEEIKLGMTDDEIKSVIARYADIEVLVDQPIVDKKRVRVTGRFTVESLSPHRTLEAPDDETSGIGESVQFETMILDNLRKAGVQNTFKGEKIVFSRLEARQGGEWIQAEGEFDEDGGSVRRVAISIGPEFGTVGAEQVALAAQEATRGVPFDVLLVTGFAFDPNAWEKAKEINPEVAEKNLGKLRVLLVRANPDLAMGNELLKKTGAGNLFMVFGEPDIEISRTGDEIVVELKGLDVYDPTTGQVRSASTADIACWFIDTNYDGTSFFVRHAYFTGGQKPYESLAKTLRAEISAEGWASLYSTTSRPFPVPETEKIALKVINHYGDEVLQVYEIK